MKKLKIDDMLWKCPLTEEVGDFDDKWWENNIKIEEEEVI